MKILFYVEPLIEMGRPYWKEGWLNTYSYKLIKTLIHSNTENEFKIIISESLSQKSIEIENTSYLVVNQDELLQPFRSYLDASMAWYLGTYTEEQLKYYYELYEKKLTDFKPDIIFSFSNVPFLQKLYPSALVLCMEFSIFSRAPFPESWFLDSLGVAGGGAGATLNKIFSERDIPELSEHSAQRIKALKAKITTLIMSKSPFKNIFQEWRNQFQNLVFVPLQFSDFYIFNGQCKYINQFDFAYDILKRTPSNIGIVFCEHPQYPVFNADTLSFFRNKFPNFLYSHEFGFYDSPGQFIIGHSDSVMTVCSSLAMQSLIWDVPLITLGNDYLDFISDGKSPENLMTILSSKQFKDKDKYLHWIVTKYAIPDFLLYKPDWLPNYLYCRKKLNAERVELIDSYFSFISDEQLFFDQLERSLKTEIPLTAHPNLHQQFEKFTVEANETINKLKKQKASILNSRSYRILAPARKLSKIIRKMI